MDSIKHFKQGRRQNRFDPKSKYGGIAGHSATKKSRSWALRFNAWNHPLDVNKQININNKRSGPMACTGNDRYSCKSHLTSTQKMAIVPCFDRPFKISRKGAKKIDMVNSALMASTIFPHYVEEYDVATPELSDQHVVFEGDQKYLDMINEEINTLHQQIQSLAGEEEEVDQELLEFVQVFDTTKPVACEEGWFAI